MMKRVLIIWALLLCFCVPAQADIYVYSSDQAPGIYFECEDFDSEIPASLAGVFDGCIEAGDEILCGTMYASKRSHVSDAPVRSEALLALRRDEKILLLGASQAEKDWVCAVETDRFFSEGQRFDLTTLPRHNSEGAFLGVSTSIVCGEEAFLVSVYADGRVMIDQYEVPWEDGSMLQIEVGMSFLYASRYKDGILQESRSATGVFSKRLCGWTYESFPRSCAEVSKWEGSGMPEFGEGEAFIFGVNLRERPTGQSKSLGQYTTRVRVLDRAEGPQAPWYQVQFDGKTGWVSGTYVLWPEHEPHRSQIMLHLSEMLYP